MGCEIKNGLLATMLALALAALVISGCSAKKEAAASTATSAPSADSQTKAAAVPPSERPFVPPQSMQGPQSGAQSVMRGGQLPPNGSEP